MKGLVLLILVTDIDTYIRVYYYVGAVHDPENILMRKGMPNRLEIFAIFHIILLAFFLH